MPWLLSLPRAQIAEKPHDLDEARILGFDSFAEAFNVFGYAELA